MYAATLFGPAYDTSNGHDAENIEVFDNVQQAIEAMFERHRAHGRRPLNVDLLINQSAGLVFPAFTAGTAMQLYEVADPAGTDGYIPSQISEIVRHVNTYKWDWYLILESNGSDYYVRTHRA